MANVSKKNNIPPGMEADFEGPEVKTVRTTVRIENNTSCFLTLPPVERFPYGVRLMPGLNSVPVKYLDALNAVEKRMFKTDKIVDDAGNMGVKHTFLGIRYPGREALEQLQTIVHIRKANGEHDGPQITIYEDALADREDGPPPPSSLPQNVDAAMAIVRATTDRAALKRWASQGKSDAAQAAGAKLNGMVNTSDKD